jgi:acylphosphatase
LDATAREAAEITIEGRVQGVGFRDFTRRHARDLALVGYVMNLSDGRVRVWAEGPHEAIQSLADRLEQGPRLARVDRIAVTWTASTGRWPTFAVRTESADR